MTLTRIFLYNSIFLSLLLFFPVCHTSPELKKDYRKNCSQLAAANLIFRVGELRKKKGLFDLTPDAGLGRAALRHAKHLSARGELLHTGPGGGPLARLRKQGVYRDLVGENIARVEHTAKPDYAFLTYWLSREVEARNLMNSRYLRIGVSFQATEKYCYCVLLMSN